MQHFMMELKFVVDTLKQQLAIYREHGQETPVFVNSPTWIAGHAAFSIHDMILRPLSSKTQLPEDYNASFRTDSSRQPESSYPSVDEVVQTLEGIFSEALNLIQNLDHSPIELPVDLKAEGFVTINNLITHTIQDIAYHNGQISYLNRFVGK